MTLVELMSAKICVCLAKCHQTAGKVAVYFDRPGGWGKNAVMEDVPPGPPIRKEMFIR